MSQFDDTANQGLSGLEQVRRRLETGWQFGMAKTLNFRLVEVDAGFAAVEGLPDESTYNPMGFVHGGYAAALLDTACGIATLSVLQSGQSFTTLELKTAYHRPITAQTGPVRAEGRILSSGRRVAYAEAKLADATGRLLASATSTLLVLSPSPL